MTGDSNGETEFPHKLLLLSNTQISRILKAFASGSSVHITFSETQLSKTLESEGFLDKFFEPLLKTGLPFNEKCT